MPKREREDAPRRTKRTKGNAYQRHRTKLVNALGERPASGIFMSCARGKERKAAAELAERMDEVRHAQRALPLTCRLPHSCTRASRCRPSPRSMTRTTWMSCETGRRPPHRRAPARPRGLPRASRRRFTPNSRSSRIPLPRSGRDGAPYWTLRPSAVRSRGPLSSD